MVITKQQALAPVSVVFPALNEEKNVGLALEALLNQDLFPAQVIFVDHNSTDKTREIAQSYASEFVQNGIDFRIVIEKKPGIANARIAACQKVTQPIIASMDTDCRPVSQWVRVIADAFANDQDLDALAGKIIFFDGSWLTKTVSKHGSYAVFYLWMRVVTGFHTLTTANAAFRKAAYLKAGGFNAQIKSINGLDDADLASRIFNGHNIRYEKKMVIYASSRRYHNFFKAIPDTIERFIALIKIVKKYRKKQHKLLTKK